MNELEKKLSRIDLNLIVSLSVLLKTRNVSRAAEELYLSQSAMSRTLQRLRDTFNDPLFNRSSQGIIPTVRALELEKILPQLLAHVEDFIEIDNFNPATSERVFNISIPPMLSTSITPPLINTLSLCAPNIHINEYPANTKPLEQLESGFLDFALHIEPTKDSNFECETLSPIVPVIFGNNNHPLRETKEITMEDCLTYPFVEFVVGSGQNYNDEHPINRLLFDNAKQRKVLHKSSQLSTLINSIENSENLMIGGKMNNCSVNMSANISALFDITLPQNKQVMLYLVSHSRINNSEAHQWLKNKIMDLFD